MVDFGVTKASKDTNGVHAMDLDVVGNGRGPSRRKGNGRSVAEKAKGYEASLALWREGKLDEGPGVEGGQRRGARGRGGRAVREVLV